MLMAVQALFAVLITVFNAAVLTQPIYRYRQLLHHNLIDGPGFQHSQMLLDGIFHGQQQAQKQIVGQIVLIQ